MDRLTSLEVLVAIVDHGGFGKAAERLGMSSTMVSAHIARLEDRLGARLIQRSTRRFALTTQGHIFLDEARAILEAVGHAENRVRQGAVGPMGRVSIDAPGGIGLRFVVPAIPHFRRVHPHVMLDLSVGDRSMLFRPDGFDMMIRVGVAPEGRGQIVELGRTRFVQVASPDYLARRGTPHTIDALHDHDCILYATMERPVGQWRFARNGERQALRPSGVATFNNGDAIAAAAVAGVGIAQTLEMLVVPELGDGRLVRVLEDWNEAVMNILLFIPQESRKRPAVQAVARFLSEAVDWTGQA
ncbi:DNA-binding transcriptional LysR family regulator [Sphingomonas zeicaulis]|uniref:LysR family transcriptional regulator n=1 Tax=Sphingomonas zeicaulis TaxID=1632740 RepID=UPI003D1E25E2